jgi:ParB family chromosome partitioning protein
MHRPASAPAAEAAALPGRFDQLPITAITASKTNPRTHFDDAYITELAGSIAEKGLIQPIIVRPRPHSGLNGTYEIVAGECRYRASKQAGLLKVPAIVRDLTDDQVLEAQLEENIHRKNLTPLEEAAGYRRLIDSNPDKHSAETIATRIGMSVGYVWDRLKLNDLIPEAKALLEAERFTVGHAILLSRLKPEDQTRAIDPDGASLFNRSRGLWAIDGAAGRGRREGPTRQVRRGQAGLGPRIRSLDPRTRPLRRRARGAGAAVRVRADGPDVEAATAQPGAARR